MFRIKTKCRVPDLTSIILSLLIISINLREPFFHSREILFALLIVTSFNSMDIIKTKYAFALIAIWFVSVSYNIFIPGSKIDFRNGGFETIIISAYLFLLCFYQKRYAKVIIDSYLFVSIIVALIITSVWVACYYSESIFLSLQSYFLNIQSERGLTVMSLDHRMILGTRYLTVWYRTSPCMVCALGYFLIQRLDEKNRYLLRIILLAVALFATGVRANILSSAMLVSMYFVIDLYKRGLRFISICLVVVAMVIVIILANRFLFDYGSQSSAIKIFDTKAYFDIYHNDIMRTLFFGWGPGSTFFSLGRQRMVSVTELSLFETIRRYGLISSCIIVFGIWFTPFRNSSLRKMKTTKYLYFCVFAAYMLCAFTNVYLLDSVGFCALLFLCTFFSYGKEVIEYNTEFTAEY